MNAVHDIPETAVALARRLLLQAEQYPNMATALFPAEVELLCRAALAAQRIEELEDALAKYGEHASGCTFDSVTGLCSCGLYAAISRRAIERHNKRLSRRGARDRHS